MFPGGSEWEDLVSWGVAEGYARGEFRDLARHLVASSATSLVLSFLRWVDVLLISCGGESGTTYAGVVVLLV